MSPVYEPELDQPDPADTTWWLFESDHLDVRFEGLSAEVLRLDRLYSEKLAEFGRPFRWWHRWVLGYHMASSRCSFIVPCSDLDQILELGIIGAELAKAKRQTATIKARRADLEQLRPDFLL